MTPHPKFYVIDEATTLDESTWDALFAYLDNHPPRFDPVMLREFGEIPTGSMSDSIYTYHHSAPPYCAKPPRNPLPRKGKAQRRARRIARQHRK